MGDCVVVVGGAPFGGVYGQNDDSSKIILEALRNGINYIDTAYWYGQGKSEKAIGKVLCLVDFILLFLINC